MGVKDTKYDTESFNAYAKMYRGTDSLNAYVNANFQLDIKDYMKDKHTGVSGDAMALHKQFVLEGAQVENQDPRTLSDVLKEIYENLPPPPKGKGKEEEDGNE